MIGVKGLKHLWRSTDMTRPNKTPEQLANEHWNWLEGIMLEEMRMKMRLFKDAFIHGYKHGKEDRHGVRTIPPKK